MRLHPRVFARTIPRSAALKTMSRLPRLFGLLVLLCSLPALSADPVLPTRSDWGQGTVRWEISAGKVMGFREGGACPSGEGPVIEAHWVDDLLVGTVKLCQKGPSCADRAFPLFAFYTRRDGHLVADFTLDPGCTSPALEEGRLILTPHAESPARESPHREARRTRAPQASGAAVHSHLELGQQALGATDGRLALEEFELALAADEDRARAYLGIGQAEMLLNRPRSALRDYRKSLAIRPEGATFFSLARAQARLNATSDALDSLRKAVAHGYDDAAQLTRDPDLAALRADPEFQRLVAMIFSRQAQRSR